MTDRLEGTDLVREVAKVIGKEVRSANELWPELGGHSIYAKSRPAGSWLEWRPDLHWGALGDVLDWLVQRNVVVAFALSTKGHYAVLNLGEVGDITHGGRDCKVALLEAVRMLGVDAIASPATHIGSNSLSS